MGEGPTTSEYGGLGDETRAAGAFAPADPVVKDPARFDPRRPIERELEIGVRDGFTLTAVGDCIATRPLAAYLGDAGFAAIVDVLRRGHVRFGNCEMTVLDITGFKGYPHAWEGDYPMVGQPEVAADLAALGFTLVSRANNHSLDWGIEGMRETSRRLDAAGLAHAGVGDHRGLARAPRYVETPEGRVGLVSFASTFLPVSEALPYRDAAPGRPGVNALKVTTKWVVTAEVMRALAVIPADESAHQETNEAAVAADGVPQRLTRFRLEFELGDEPGTSYEVDTEDLADILRNVRLGKQHADFLIAALHSHEARNELPFPEAALLPADFVRPVAHAAIDAGADAFVCAGTHNLGPIEVYRGRPVFYGLGNFIWSDLQEPLAADLYHSDAARRRMAAAFVHPERATHADYTAATEAVDFANEWIFESMVTKSVFAGGRLSELELHPVWLRYGEPLTKSGIPMPAPPERAQKILAWLREMSAPYGTEIRIEDGVGRVRIAAGDAAPAPTTELAPAHGQV